MFVLYESTAQQGELPASARPGTKESLPESSRQRRKKLRYIRRSNMLMEGVNVLAERGTGSVAYLHGMRDDRPDCRLCAGRLLKFSKAITESRIARVERRRFGRKCAAWGIVRGIWGGDASVRPRGRRRSRRGGGADRCLSGRSAVIRRTR